MKVSTVSVGQQRRDPASSRVLPLSSRSTGAVARTSQDQWVTSRVHPVASNTPPPGGAHVLPMPSARGTRSVPGELSEVRDGGFVGAGGRSYSNKARLPPGWASSDSTSSKNEPQRAGEVLSPILPAQGEPREDIILVNGIYTPPALTYSRAKYLANTAGARVIALHNAHDGMWADLGQVINDDLNPEANAATRTLTAMIYRAISEGRELHLLGHSQGALIVASALYLVARRLRKHDGLTDAQVEAKLGLLKVETHGGGASNFPDGPRYVHYVNMADIVPNTTGVGSMFQLLNPLIRPGRGAVIRRFAELHWPKAHPAVPPEGRKGFEIPRALDGSFHGVEGIYFDQREPFDEAYAEGSGNDLLENAAHTALSLFWLAPNLVVEILRFLAWLAVG